MWKNTLSVRPRETEVYKGEFYSGDTSPIPPLSPMMKGHKVFGNPARYWSSSNLQHNIGSDTLLPWLTTEPRVADWNSKPTVLTNRFLQTGGACEKNTAEIDGRTRRRLLNETGIKMLSRPCKSLIRIIRSSMQYLLLSISNVYAEIDDGMKYSNGSLETHVSSFVFAFFFFFAGRQQDCFFAMNLYHELAVKSQ